MIQIFGIDEFMAMMDGSAGRAAMDERDAMRSLVYDKNATHAEQNGVDENFVWLYAQCAMQEFDRRNIQ